MSSIVVVVWGYADFQVSTASFNISPWRRGLWSGRFGHLRNEGERDHTGDSKESLRDGIWNGKDWRNDSWELRAPIRRYCMRASPAVSGLNGNEGEEPLLGRFEREQI